MGSVRKLTNAKAKPGMFLSKTGQKAKSERFGALTTELPRPIIIGIEGGIRTRDHPSWSRSNAILRHLFQVKSLTEQRTIRDFFWCSTPELSLPIITGIGSGIRTHDTQLTEVTLSYGIC